MTHPLAISFVLLAGSLLEAGSRLRLRVGKEAGRGRGRGALFTRQGPAPSRHPYPHAERDDKRQSPRLGRQGVLIGVSWPLNQYSFRKNEN